MAPPQAGRGPDCDRPGAFRLRRLRRTTSGIVNRMGGDAEGNHGRSLRRLRGSGREAPSARPKGDVQNTLAAAVKSPLAKPANGSDSSWINGMRFGLTTDYHRSRPPSSQRPLARSMPGALRRTGVPTRGTRTSKNVRDVRRRLVQFSAPSSAMPSNPPGACFCASPLLANLRYAARLGAAAANPPPSPALLQLKLDLRSSALRRGCGHGADPTAQSSWIRQSRRSLRLRTRVCRTSTPPST